MSTTRTQRLRQRANRKKARIEWGRIAKRDECGLRDLTPYNASRLGRGESPVLR